MRNWTRARRLDGWLIAIFACIGVMPLLVIAAVLRWSVPWWIYATAFSLCLLMPLWAAWRYRLRRGRPTAGKDFGDA